NPGTFLKAIAIVLVVALVVLLWFAEQIGDFRRRLAQGFAILKDRRAYLRRVALWQGVDWGFRLLAVLFFLRAFGLPVTVHNAIPQSAMIRPRCVSLTSSWSRLVADVFDAR